MPKYSVIVTADATMSQTVIVAAPSEQAACELAIERINYNAWELDDNYPSDIYTNGADEIEDEMPRLCRTRADLFQRPRWAALNLYADSSGNPCVWENFYQSEDGSEGWSDVWSCMCEDDGVEPYESVWIGPDDEAEVALWESLPEAE